MTKIEALEKSVEHWKDNVLTTISHLPIRCDTTVCALCVKYYDNGCRGCPVKINTGKDYCMNSPLSDVQDIIDPYIGLTKTDDYWTRLLKACFAEYTFLLNLLNFEKGREEND